MNHLDINQIKDIIPHRHPFLLIDYIEDYVPGEYAVGYKCVSYREEFFAGHFPQEPVMPGVLTIVQLQFFHFQKIREKQLTLAELTSAVFAEK